MLLKHDSCMALLNFNASASRWAMVYHYTVVAWSRWAAVQWPNWFRVLPPATCLGICAMPWVAGLLQSVIEHQVGRFILDVSSGSNGSQLQFDWFVPLYFNPTRYGMDSDWERYNALGTNTYYMICNVVFMVLPFPFYAAALIILFRRQAERTISEFGRIPRLSLRQVRRMTLMGKGLSCQLHGVRNAFLVGRSSWTMCSIAQGCRLPSTYSCV